MDPRTATLQVMEASSLLPRSAALKARALEIQENLAMLEIVVNKIQAHKPAHKIMDSKPVLSKLQGPAIMVVLKVTIPLMAVVLQEIRAMEMILLAIYLQGAAR
tara:strand:- start:756 stop:1067 length:312 start_codon:yes stop_codon:yes gene_type:complete